MVGCARQQLDVHSIDEGRAIKLGEMREGVPDGGNGRSKVFLKKSRQTGERAQTPGAQFWR